MSSKPEATTRVPQESKEATETKMQKEAAAELRPFGGWSQESNKKPVFDRNSIENDSNTHQRGFSIGQNTTATSGLFGGPSRISHRGGLFSNTSNRLPTGGSSTFGPLTSSAFGEPCVADAGSPSLSQRGGGLFGNTSSGFATNRPSSSTFGVPRVTNANTHDESASAFGYFGHPASTGFIDATDDDENSDDSTPVEVIREGVKVMREVVRESVREIRDYIVAELTELEEGLESNEEKLEARVKALEGKLEDSQRKNEEYERRIADMEVKLKCEGEKGKIEEIGKKVKVLTLDEKK